MPDNALECTGIETGYKRTQILWGINLSIVKGEIVSLLGPNGAGKTTLAKTIMGFLPPWKGSIKAFGTDITRMPTHERVKIGINMVPEGRRLFPELSVMENILLGSYTMKNSSEIQDIIEEISTLFPVLRERRSQKAKTLSGGEQQMLAIARALMSRPKILILDEPTLGLSPKLSSEVISYIKKLRDELGIAILLIEEKIKLALTISDRIYVMNQGKMVYEASKDRFLHDEKIFMKYVGI